MHYGDQNSAKKTTPPAMIDTHAAGATNLPAAPLKPVIGLVVLLVELVVLLLPLLPPFDEPEPEPEPEPSEEPPVLVPVEEVRAPVEDPVALPPEVEVELPETKMPPAIAGGAVLSPVLLAAIMYASRVLGEGGALI